MITKQNTKTQRVTDQQNILDTLVSRIFESAIIKNEHSFLSECDGYQFNLERDSEYDNWYIQVNPVERSFIYDGWWKCSEYEPIEAAIREAIHGAGILDG